MIFGFLGKCSVRFFLIFPALAGFSERVTVGAGWSTIQNASRSPRRLARGSRLSEITALNPVAQASGSQRSRSARDAVVECPCYHMPRPVTPETLSKRIWQWIRVVALQIGDCYWYSMGLLQQIVRSQNRKYACRGGS